MLYNKTYLLLKQYQITDIQQIRPCFFKKKPVCMVLQFTDDLNVFSISNWCYENIKMYRIQFSWNKGGCKYCFRVTNECLYAKNVCNYTMEYVFKTLY